VGAVAVLAVAVALVVSLSAPRAIVYANEAYSPPAPDLSPPPLPKVSTADEATRIITADALYGQSVPAPTKCVLPTINLVTAGTEELEPYLNQVVGCLMAVWVDPMTAAGHELPRPPVIVYTKPIATGCGKITMQNAFYCPADQTIYYAIDIMDGMPAEVQQGRMVDEATIAHEFGHAIQARTGIMNGAAALQQQAATPADEEAFSRREELQADCFSGLFIRSIGQFAALTQHDLDVIGESARIIGDDTLAGVTAHDHGRGANRLYWTQLGMASTSIGVCNTWVAAADVVS
jgi:predicted metalloprotease